ncbi:FeoB-associated Cys-rich membrane protein [Leeia oryzae]|uniref:FeoB-associated Cys-rich membrane protein n=1 Tax=Leeia oryzae TaxID=356662 RepID=UPI0003610B03|nr:FeoB-associated Cys-rich membrane protein [Leeia oryzae]
MSADWLQTAIVGLCVAGAAAFVLRKYVLKKPGASTGCGSCSGCGTKRCSK